MSDDRFDFLVSKGVSTEEAETFVRTTPAAISRLMNGDTRWEGHSFDQHFAYFTDFCPACKASENSDVLALFFLNPAYAAHQNLKSIRYQSSRTGGAQAAAQWLHYQLDIQSSELNPDVGSVNIAKFILDTWNPVDIVAYLHLSKTKRIDAVKTICELTRLNQQDLYRFSFCYSSDESDELWAVNDTVCEMLFKRLRSQPGLVTDFQVTEEFLDKDGPVVFSGSACLTDKEPKHAMLVIGMWKEEETGEYNFVLQNWSNKQFISVTAQYFASCHGVIHLLPEGQQGKVHILPTVPLLYDHAIETDIEGEEQFDEEYYYDLEDC